MPTEKTILIFGGAGFIGSHLLRDLSQKHKSVRLISVDIRSPRFKTAGVEYVNQDIRNLSDFDVEGEVDLIYNLAAVHTTPGHPTHEYYETNIQGATEITGFARRKKVQTIAFTSSISVYGPSEETKSEETKPAPESAYGWSKYLAEGIHRAWLYESSDRRLVICRPAVIFGRAEGGNFTRLAKLMKRGGFIYPGRKDTIKACFYVGDLIEALERALALNERYILFNGCYPDRYTLEEIIETLKSNHFPKARTFMIPKAAVLSVAAGLKPFSAAGLGIHPDRVMKLIRSTDILPGWLTANGMDKPKALPSAFDRWKVDSNGSFE